MANLHFVGGEKGGVGKSLTSRLLAQYCIDTGKPFIGFDSDRSHGSFSRFYGEFTSPVTVDDFESLDLILEAAEAHPDAEIIVDLAAQTAGRLGRWLDDSDVIGILSELGYGLVVWHVMDDGLDSMQLLDTVLDAYPHSDIRFVAVLNRGRGEHFDHFLQSEICRTAQARNTRVLTLDRLESRLAQKIDFNGYSFWAAANSRELMSIVERRRVGAWLRKAYEQFDAVFAPEVEPSTSASS